MKNHFNCIYMYENKINGKIYIGQAMNFNKRHRDHCKTSNNSIYIDRALKKYGKDNFNVYILIENLDSQEEMNIYEKLFIEQYDSLAINGKGYNITEGGYSHPWKNKNEEEIKIIKQKISEKSKERQPMLGKHHSEESKEKISKALKGENNPMWNKHHTDEIKDKMSKNSTNKKTINQYDLNGNFIRTWESSSAIMKYYNYSTSTNIRKCCRYYLNPEKFMQTNKYPIKQAYGYIWKFA